MRVLNILAALVCASIAAQGQNPTAADLRKLSLEDCLVVALENNFDIQIARYNPQIARFVLASSYGVYDPTLNLSGQHDHSLSPGGVDAEGRVFTGSEMDANTIGGSLGGYLPWGLRYGLGGSMSDRWGTKPGFDVDQNSPTGFTTNYFTDINGNQVGLVTTNYALVPTRIPFENTSGQVGVLNLQQPLLKDFWIDQPRLTIFMNKKNVGIEEANFRDRVMTTVTAVENAYFNLIDAEENVVVQTKALELAEKLLAENKKRVEVGALAPLDEKQAESQAAASRADLLLAQATRDTKERLLKNLLSDDYTNEWMSVSIVPTDPLLAQPRTFDLQESWRKGLAQGPSLQQQRLILEQLDRSVRYRRNQLFPQVDLIGSYGYSASSTEFSGALDQVRSGDNPFWSFGAQMSIPLSQTEARHSFKASKAGREQSALQLKALEQGRLILIEDSIGNARSSFQRVDATRQARLYAEAALDAEQKKLANGKSTSFVVLELQRNLTAARSAEIRALADYNIALAALAFAEGSTLERRQIDLDMKSLSTTLYHQGPR